MTKRQKKIRGVRTMLDGVNYRSNTEANAAVVLNAYGASYEPKRFQMLVPVTYIPDFYIKRYDLWIEVKGCFTLDDRRKVSTFSQEHLNFLVVLQKRNAKMHSRRSTNESFLETADIPYTYVDELEEYLYKNYATK
jgi:hypothetical protein